MLLSVFVFALVFANVINRIESNIRSKKRPNSEDIIFALVLFYAIISGLFLLFQ